VKFIRLLILCSLFLVPNINRGNTYAVIANMAPDSALVITCETSSEAEALLSENKRPNPLLQIFHKKQSKNKKLVAAVLAFPFPFGIVGLHRIYLGCAPYVPVAYIASLGGIFGILPFIDFCVLVVNKDTDKYINSKKVFMWVH